MTAPSLFRRRAWVLAALSLAAPAAAQAPPPPLDPVEAKVESLKEAADLLGKANASRARGNRSLAEQLFSTAELIVGADALAEIAPLFRAGAPPRVTTPLVTMAKDTPAQPVAVGSSDADEPEPPKKGSLSGSVSLANFVLVDGFSVVTLEPASGKWHRRKPRQRIMEQRGRQFAPRLLVVPVGSTVTFPNFDSVYHNVFSTSDVQPFDLGLYKNGQARAMTFDKEGIVRIGCNLHANMSAHIVVTSAPHYAITDDKGHFRFGSLEPGRYKLRAWSERSTAPTTMDVVIKPERNAVHVTVAADAPTGPAPDKFGVSRGGKGF